MDKKVIHKYALDVREHIQELQLPDGSEFLYLSQQRNPLEISLWFLVPLETSYITKRRFKVYATGETVDRVILNHLGTVVDNIHGLVWHIMELQNG